MSFPWYAPIIKTKMRFSKVVHRFKRKISVVEMTEPPHPSLDDFLAQHTSGPDQTYADSSSYLSMCSTCHDKMQIQSDVQGTKDTEPVSPATAQSRPISLSQVSLIFVPGKSENRDSRIFGLTSRPATTVAVPPVIQERQSSEDTIMASTPSLVQAFRDCIPEHPALFDLPPPFSRHSDPTSRDGPAKHAELVRKASHTAVIRKCSDLDDEVEKLATRLEETEKELSDTTQQLESTIEELAAREASHQDMREKYVEMKDAISYRVRQHNATVLELQGLQQELAKYEQRRNVDQQKIESLLKCRHSRHCTLREKIISLNDQLETTEAKLDRLETATRFQHDLFDHESKALRLSNDGLQTQNQRLEEYVRVLESQRSSEDDIQATHLAEREVYVVHERLRLVEGELNRLKGVEKELGLRRTSLEVVRQNNRDLVAENVCLRQRMKERDPRVARYTV